MVLFSQVKNEIWTDYIHNHYLNNKWVLYGDATVRFGGSFVVGIRPSFKYLVSNNISLRGGIGNNYFLDGKNNISTIEIRPWQGVRVVWPQTRFFSLQHYVRVEEQYTSNGYGDKDFEGSVRIRYQIGTDVDIWESESGDMLLKIPIEYEVFNTFNKSDYFIDRDRFILGLSFAMRNLLTLEFNYVLQRAGESLRNMNNEKSIYRFRIRHTFDKRKKKN